ncbi:MAG: o-succinylbenzoate--CoA ligase [Anaerohalosphaera sp.]|nr:o-succinylbenzoate--CoA ligase [Anaerohalosphaera sp.]
MNDDRQIKFHLLIDETIRFLGENGVSSNDRIAVLSPNSIDYIAFIIACWRIGATVVPVSTRYPADMINVSLAAVDCDKIFVANEFCHLKLTAKRYKLNHEPTSRATFVCCGEFVDYNFDLDKNADIIFTSGSSDVPKAVLHTLSNHYYSAVGSEANIPFRAEHTWLLTLPLYHISGFSLIMRALLHGGSIAFAAAGESLSESIITCDFTHVSLVPTQLAQLMAMPECLAKLKLLSAILVGGGPIRSSLVKKAIDHNLPIYITYGSTEMSSQITTTSKKCQDLLNGSSSTILPHRKLRIDVDGHICVKGDTLFKGYVNGSTVSLPADEDGYFRTGDIGSVDQDGSLYVTGRADNMFISGGENIYPEQIERAIGEIETVQAVVVVDVNCGRYGQRPAAFIKMLNDLPIDQDEFKARLGDCLEVFKVPVAFYPWPDNVSTVKPSRKFFRDLAARFE